MKTGLKKVGVLVCLAIILTGCSGRRGVVEIRVVATTDVHGHIFDKDLLDGTERKGSLAKVATLLKKERKQNKNVLYLDAGDILQGSVEVYQDVTSQFYRKSLPAQAYGYLGCSAMAMGNHDLAVGALSYERYFSDSNYPTMGANVFFERYGDYIWPYTIVEKDGVKISILGLTTPVVNYTIPKDRLNELEAHDVVDAARHYVSDLRERTDVVIGLFHSGYDGGRVYNDSVYENFTRAIVDKVPGFDLIVFGHDHTPYCGKAALADGDSILMMNGGPYAMKAAAVTLYVDFSHEGKPKVSAGQGELIDVTTLEPDAGFMKSVSGWYSDVSQYADSVIGRLSVPLECNGALWRPTSTLDYIHEIQMGFFGAQISLAAPVSTRTSFPAGDFRIRDTFSLYQFDNTMVSVMLKGSEVKNILEYSADMFYEDLSRKPEHLLKLKDADNGTVIPQAPASGFISAAGIKYTIDVTKPYGKRVEIKSMSDGSTFDPDRRYRTTINSFLYSGTESVLIKGSGLDRLELLSRLNCSSEADIRYYILTNLALSKEGGRGVAPRKVCSWKLVPEDVVSGYLAKDTVNFKLK